MYFPNTPLASFYLTAAQMSNVTIVLLYSALLVVITSVISLRTKDPDPMLAGRDMPWWLISASIVGTSISSIAFLAIPAKGFLLDFNFIISKLWETAIGLPIALIFFVGFLRKTRDASIYTLLGDRFGKWASAGSALAFVVYSIIRMGVITYLVAKALELICGTDILGVMLLIGVIVIFYTYMSGIEGVIWTSLFQSIILVVGGLGAAYFLFDGVNLSNHELLDTALSKVKTASQSAVFEPDWRALLPMMLFFIVECIYDYSASQDIGQRYLVARNEVQAKKGLLAAGLIIPCIVALFFLIGVLLYLFQEVHPGLLLEGVNSTDGVFGYFIANHFPNGLKGLAVIGLLAAAMSSIDTGINSGSTVLVCNLYEPYAKSTPIRQSLMSADLMRSTSVILGILGIIAGYMVYFTGENAFDSFWKGIGLLIPSIFGLFLLMRISKKAGPIAGKLGAAMGFLVAAWMTLTEGVEHPLASPFHYMLAMPMGVLTTVLVGWISSLFISEAALASVEPQAKTEQEATKVQQRRKRIKRNVVADSLWPKPLYRVYVVMALLVYIIIYVEGGRLDFVSLDYKLLMGGMLCLFLVIVLPFFVEDVYSKAYACTYLTLLALGFPFLWAVTFFIHPEVHTFGYLFLIAVAYMGNLIGWTIMALITMVSAALASQLSLFIYPQVGVADNWEVIAAGALGIFSLYAVFAAREHMASEQVIAVMHTILEKVYAETEDVDFPPLNPSKPPRYGRLPGEVRDTLRAFIGATNTNPEEIQIEISVRKTLDKAVSYFNAKVRASLQIKGDEDFKVLGDPEAFEKVLFELLKNAFYYVYIDEATEVICTLDAKKRTLSVANNGPTIKPVDYPYIFDLSYTAEKPGLGLGLTYCKKMLEGMRSAIRLVSKPYDEYVCFRLYFPSYVEELAVETERPCLEEQPREIEN